MARRFFSYEPQLGITTYCHLDPNDPDRMVFEKVWDREPILEQAAIERRETRGQRWGEMRKVGSIPLPLYYLWRSVYRDDEDGFMKRVIQYLNDPDYKNLRTFEGKL